MKTALISPVSNALSASPETTGSPAPAPSPGGPGRPSGLNAQMLDALCTVIRETGASDSAAAARVGVHPSTVSRWKRDCPDFAILLRAAREEFREAQLAIIYAEETAGRVTSWRAAAWVLERIFPEDYAPRAAERARFQELYEARCAREVEGAEQTMGQSDNETIGMVACDRGGALQNVQNAAACPVQPAAEGSGLPVRALQNVQKPLGGSREPQMARMTRMEETSAKSAKSVVQIRSSLPEEVLQNVQNGAAGGDRALEGNGAPREGAIHVGDHVSHGGEALQNVQNSAPKTGSGAPCEGSVHVEDHVSHGGEALQNVQNSASETGSCDARDGAIHVGDHVSHRGEALQNVQNSASKMGNGAPHAASIHGEGRVGQVEGPGASVVERGREED